MINGDIVNGKYMESAIIHGCSGTMLTNEWAIGCNHCYSYDMDGRSNTINVFYGGTKSHPEQQRGVEQIIRHPTNTAGINPYFQRLPGMDGFQGIDVVLFKLASPLEINGSTSGFRREIWPFPSSELQGKDITCLGWGLKSANLTSDELRKAILRVTKVELDLVVNGVPVGDRASYVANSKGQIIVGGDSGGGAFFERNGIWYLVAVTAGHFTPLVDGFSVLVSHHAVYNWVKKIVFQEFGSSLRDEWEAFDGVITSAPAAASWSTGRLDVFVRGSNGHLMHKFFDGGWHNWEDRGGELIDAPAAVSWGPNRIDCFARGIDNRLCHLWYENGWKSWEAFDGVITSAPAVASWSSGRLDVFARGRNGHLMHKLFDGRWQPWEDRGVELIDAPAAVSWGPNRIDCFARGIDNRVQHFWYDSGWGSRETFDGVVSSGPAVASSSTNRLDLFARGLNSNLLHKWYDNTGWSGWKNLGGQIIDTPGAVSWGPNRIDCFGRGLDSRMYHKWSK